MYDNRYLLVFVDILGRDIWHCNQIGLKIHWFKSEGEHFFFFFDKKLGYIFIRLKHNTDLLHL